MRFKFGVLQKKKKVVQYFKKVNNIIKYFKIKYIKY